MKSLLIPRSIEERIIQAMARALWASKYADAYDNGELPEGSDHAGAGEDWIDHCGETPVRAYMAAAVFAEDLLTAARDQAKPKHIACLWQVFGRAIGADDDKDSSELYNELDDVQNQTLQDEFGHLTAMQSMGHGVGWADDHERLPFEVPRTLEHLSWQDLKD